MLKKTLLIILGTVVLLAAGGYWYLKRYVKSADFNKTIQERLTQLVREKSNGKYSLTIGEIHVNPDKQSASLRNIDLIPDTSLVVDGMMYAVHLDNLLLKKVDVAALMTNQSVDLGNITVAGGKLELTNLGKMKPAADSTPPAGVKAGKKKLFQSLKASPLTGIQIDSLQLDQIELVYHNRKKKMQRLRNIHIDLIGLALNSASIASSDRVLFSKSVKVGIDSIDFPVAQDKYRMKASQLILTMGDKNVALVKNMQLRPVPNQSLEAAAAKTGVQKDVYQVNIKTITAAGFDYTALLEDSTIRASSVLLSQPELTVFNDKSNPPATDRKVGKYPHQLLRKLPYKTDIPEMVVEKGSVHYNEKNEKGDGVGKIVFTNISGKLGPLKDDGIKPIPLKAQFQASFMGRSGVSVRFDFPISNDGQFIVNATFNAFDATQLNAATLPLGSTKIASGKIDRLAFTVKGNNNAARAFTTMNYENLKIEVMKGDAASGYQKRGLLSAIANAFVLKENNRRGDKLPDQTSATYKRVTTKSFFNLVWKSVFYSVKQNVGVGLMGKDKERATIHK